MSRVVSVVKNYSAPLVVYRHLSTELDRRTAAELSTSAVLAAGAQPESVQLNVCVGKEWYRFPGSYFLPHAGCKLQYVRSEFRALLPKLYDSWDRNGTWGVPSEQNDRNADEPGRYIDVDQCDYIIDADSSHPTKVRTPRARIRLHLRTAIIASSRSLSRPLGLGLYMHCVLFPSP